MPQTSPTTPSEFTQTERNVVTRALRDLARNTCNEEFAAKVRELADRVENES